MREMERMERTRPVQMTEEAGGEFFAVLERLPSRLFYLGAMGALFGSAYLFFQGKRNWALFVGQWVPTLLMLPLFHKLIRPSQEPTVQGIEEATREAGRGAREFMQRGR
jgi:hypothetical protein